MKKDRGVRLAMEPKHWEVFTAPAERVGDVEDPGALDQMLNGGGAVREASRWYARSRRRRRVRVPKGSKAKVLTPKPAKARREVEGERDEPSSAGARRRDRAVSSRAARRRCTGCALVCYSNRASDDALRGFEGGRVGGTGA